MMYNEIVGFYIPIIKLLELQMKQEQVVTDSFIIIYMVIILYFNMQETLHRTNDLAFWTILSKSQRLQKFLSKGKCFWELS